ncbi:MAG: hypothetical protein WBV82_22750 [Myxococcaceae bacterium]
MSPNSRILLAAAVGIATVCGACQCERTPTSGAAGSDAGVTAPVRTALAELSELKGAVTLERDGQRRPAAAKDPVFANDAVETASDAEVQIRFPDGRVIEIGPDARLVFREDASGLLLDVQRGLVLSRAPAEPKSAPGGASAARVTIRILTPFGLTRIGEGESEVAIDVGQESAKVEVRIGTIELVSREGAASQTASAGDTLNVTVGEIQFLARQGESLMLDPIVVVLREESGAAEVRKKGARSWNQVGRDGESLAEGDAIRVRRGRSRMNLDGSMTAVTIENGGEILFEKSGRAEDLEESRFELKRGGVAMQLAPDRRSRVVVSGSILESSQGGFFTLQKTRDGLQISAIAGDLLLRRGEAGDQEISAGEVATVGRASEVKLARQGTPELTLPSRRGLRVFHDGVERGLITWRGEAADYRVRVAEDARFESVLVEGTVHAPNLAVDLPRRGALYWEILDATGAKVDSGSATFAPEPRLKDLERLRNEVADGAEKTTIFYQDKPPAVTFTVAAEEGAARYKVAVFRASALDKPIAERAVAQTRIPLEAGVLTEGSYLWSVTPLSATGEALRGGKMNKLELVYDNSVPSLVIRAPANGERVGRAVRTSGVAPVGSRLYVNGRAVELDAKNRFDAEITSEGGLIIYRLVRPDSPDAVYVRSVRRSGR